MDATISARDAGSATSNAFVFSLARRPKVPFFLKPRTSRGWLSQLESSRDGRQIWPMKFVLLQFSTAGYVVDSLFYVLWIVVASGTLVRFGPRREYLAIALFMGGGLIIWSFLEYALHRFVLHGIEPFRSMHAQHHDHPHALIGIPTLVSATLFAALVLAPAVAMTDFWRGTGLMLGIGTGYLAYGWIHHATHHWCPRTRWLKHRKQLHAMHHRARDRQYGVTTSLWDWVFRSGFIKQRSRSCVVGS